MTTKTTPKMPRKDRRAQSVRDSQRLASQMSRELRAERKTDRKKPAPAPTRPTPTPEAPTGGINLLDRAICLTFNIRKIGLKRRLSSEAVEVDADKQMIRVAKLIIESDEWKAIQRLDNDARHYIYRRALPATFFRDGVYLLALDLIAEVDATLCDYATRREPLVEAFIAAYPSLVEDARRRLGPLFDPTEYPSVESLRGAFDFRWSYVAFGLPGAQLSRISSALAGRAAREFERSMAAAVEDVRGALREGMAALVDEMVEKMTDRSGGKSQVFRDSFIPRVNDFLNTFQARNLTDDAALAALVTKARALLSGVDAETVRERGDVRASIRQGFQTIKTAIAPMLQTKRRAIAFGDD